MPQETYSIASSPLKGRDSLLPERIFMEIEEKHLTVELAREIINSSFISQNLKPYTLKNILGTLTDTTLLKSETNAIAQLQAAIGIEPNVRIEKTVTIERAPEELYDYWRNLTNLPNFMHHLRSVTAKDEAGIVTHWVANAPLNNTVEWDAKIVIDEPHSLIAWSSLDNADIENCGMVSFRTATGERGTTVKVVLEYKPPGGKLGDAIAQLFGESPQQQIGDELNRFKQLMETGEIATTQGQSQGS
jgi:uncharacterized membrane protein